MNVGSDGVLTRERPHGGSHPDRQVDEQRRRRRVAEAAADAAEAAAADAAARASTAIAAAARAAAEAEIAADVAARTAGEAEAAAAAERHAVERAHTANAVTANETTAVAMAPIAGGRPPGPPVPAFRANGARHQVQGAPAANVPAVNVPGQALAPDEAAVAGAPTMAMAPIAATVGGAPAGVHSATGGRAARRRAQEAAAAVALEATRDPDTNVIALKEDVPAEVTPRRSRRADQSTGSRVTSLLNKVRNRPGGRVVLAATAVGGVILVAAVVAGLVNGTRGPSNAAVVEAAPTSEEAPATSEAVDPGSVTGALTDGAVDTTTPEAVAYLKALRSADVPTSDSGQAETEAAAVICQQLSRGTAADDLVKALPAVLPSVNGKQAEDVVSIAQKKYCS